MTILEIKYIFHCARSKSQIAFDDNLRDIRFFEMEIRDYLIRKFSYGLKDSYDVYSIFRAIKDKSYVYSFKRDGSDLEIKRDIYFKNLLNSFLDHLFKRYKISI